MCYCEQHGDNILAKIETRECDIEYAINGSGLEIVWAHGLASSMKKEDLFSVINFKSLQDKYKLVRYDARGHGESGYTMNIADYTLENLAKDQLSLTEKMGLQNYIAAGISMGASTAITAAVLNPDRIKALILVLLPTAWEYRINQADRYSKMADFIEVGNVEAFQGLMKSVPLPDPLSKFSARKDNGPMNIEKDEQTRLSIIFRGLSRTDLPSPEIVSKIKQPTLILAWTGDENHPLTTTARFQELVPHSKIILATTFDGVKKWNNYIDEFLQELK
jgi:pimeloyl-ACP methyl ester carboxylesterase